MRAAAFCWIFDEFTAEAEPGVLIYMNFPAACRVSTMRPAGVVVSAHGSASEGAFVGEGEILRWVKKPSGSIA